jgi:hypothetical protein
LAGTFNDCLVTRLVGLLGKDELTTSDTGDRRYPSKHGIDHKFLTRLLHTQVLCYKVSHRLDPDSVKFVDAHPLVQNLSMIVNELVSRQGPLSNDATECLRLQYAENVCDAAKGLGFTEYEKRVSPQHKYEALFPVGMLLIAQAAIGDPQVLPLYCETFEDVISPQVSFLPNILDAAVAADQIDLVDELLEFLLAHVRGKPEINTWDEMRTVANAIGNALRVAVRMSRNEVGLLIITFLRNHWKSLGRSMKRQTVRKIYDDCVEFGNIAFYSTVLYWRREDELPEYGTNSRLKLTKFEFGYICRHGLPILIQHLINTGSLRPDSIEGESPLWLALQARKYRVAKALIDNGANIDGILPGGQLTAYWQARRDRNGDAQWYLITWGADTREMRYHGTDKSIDRPEWKHSIKTNSAFEKEYQDWEPERDKDVLYY